MIDNDSKKRMRETINLAIALGIAAVSTTAKAHNAQAPQDMEKCYGIVKAGMNDCGSSMHSCASGSTKDSDPNEWLYVPKGTCDKIVGGKTK